MKKIFLILFISAFIGCKKESIKPDSLNSTYIFNIIQGETGKVILHSKDGDLSKSGIITFNFNDENEEFDIEISNLSDKISAIVEFDHESAWETTWQDGIKVTGVPDKYTLSPNETITITVY